jgi:pyrroline-5-carboxylate reductase
MKIAFIGGGNMGEAMLSAIINKRIASEENITVSDISESRRHFLEEKYSILTTLSNQLAVSGAVAIVLAVKPQVLDTVMSELKNKIKPSQLVVSIVAGKSIRVLREGLGHDRIVRSIPNTPSQIGEGVTVWTDTAEVTTLQKKRAAKLLGAMGIQMYVEDERFIDMATAVSGSGPAYLFYFVEAFVEAAVNIGWDQNAAKEMVLNTILGSAHLIKQSGREPAELRRMVTSPGGTTAEAVRIFDEGKLKDLISDAVKVAYIKARSLGSSS